MQQPTAFDLILHTPSAVFESANLSESLKGYSQTQGQSRSALSSFRHEVGNSSSGELFLQVTAKADFVTTDPTLSREGLLVDVEISPSCLEHCFIENLTACNKSWILIS